MLTNLPHNYRLTERLIFAALGLQCIWTFICILFPNSCETKNFVFLGNDKQWTFLTDDKYETNLIKDSIVAGLKWYQNIWNGSFPFNAYMWWGPEDFMASSQFTCCKKFKNTVIHKIPNILYCTINLHLDATEDITDGIIDIGSTIKRLYFYLWNFTTRLLLVENRELCKRYKRNFEIKKCLVFVQLFQSKYRLLPMIYIGNLVLFWQKFVW